MKRIKLSSGRAALVDDDVYEAARKFHWYEDEGVVVRAVYISGVKYRLMLHRVVLDAPDELNVEFKDGNPLNCQRKNMRTVKRSCLLKKRKGTSSRYKGVTLSRGRWLASIRVDTVLHHLGRFKSEEKAARAYDRAARLYHGSFARTNEKLGLL